MSTDAIVLLKEDHKQIRRLFKEFQDAGENATVTKRRIVEKILEGMRDDAPRKPAQPGALKGTIDAATA